MPIRRSQKKRSAELQQKQNHRRPVIDPLVNPGSSAHRHQARSKTDQARPHHRMVTLAQSSPGDRSARAPQSKTATVMLAPDAMRYPSDPQSHIGSDFSAGIAVPPVDTFRAAAVNNVQVPGERGSIGKSALRAFTALLLAACLGLAAIAWQSSGNVAKQIIAKWAPKF